MATNHYRIRPGFTFRDGDEIKGGGDTIELSLDMAIVHRDKLEPLEPLEAPAVVGVEEPDGGAEVAPESEQDGGAEGVQTSAQAEAVEG